jgi:hypothetical protein
MILMVLLVGLAATTAAGKEIKKDYHETFAVQAGDRLHLVHGDGEVNIEPWERDEIDITVVYHTEFSKVGVGSDPDFEVEFRQSGGTVTVIGKEAQTVVVGFTSRRHYEYSYTIRAPEYLRLDLEGDDGDVQIVKWRRGRAGGGHR